MKKIASVVVLSLVLVTLLAACGNGDSAKNKDSKKDNTLVVYSPNSEIS